MDTTYVKQMYDSGKTLKEIATELGTYPQKVHRILQGAGYEARSASETQTKWRREHAKFTYNRHFLDEYNPQSAWFIGLMFADGSIWQDSYRAALTSKDLDLLEQVRDLLESDFPIQLRATTPQLIMYGGDFTKRLSDYGIYPHKSITKQFPDVPRPFLSHFIRGYWDGNGTISIRKEGWLSLGVEIGSRDFIDGIYATMSLMFQPPTIRTRTRGDHMLKGHVVHSNQPVHSIALSGERARTFLNWMYKDSTPQTRLARKYEKARLFLTDHS